MNALALPDTKALETRESALLEKARSTQITTQDQYVSAVELGQLVAGMMKEVEKTFDPVTKAAKEAHRQACAARDKHLLPLEEAKALLSKKGGAWNAEQERIRREKEIELQATALKLEQDRRIAQAAALEKSGDTEEAEALMSAPVQAPVVMLEKETPKIKGAATAKNWKFRIINAAAIPREYLIPDEVKIGQVVRALKDQFKVEGIEVYAEEGMRFGK